MHSFLTERRRWCALAVTGVCALYLARLGEPGFWDPLELDAVDRALGAAPERGSALATWLPRVGLRAAGTGELGGRLPGALVALAAIAVTWWWGRRVAGARIGAVAALLTACAPLVVVEARVITGAPGALLGNVLAIAGATALLDGRARSAGLACAAAGAAVGSLASGVVIGVAAPAAAVAAAATGRWRAVAIGLAVGAVGLGVAGLVPLGAAVDAPPRELAWDATVERIAHGGFPWIALVLPALAMRERVSAAERIAVAWACAAFVACSALDATVGLTPFPAVPALALLAAGWIDAVAAGKHTPAPGAVAIAVLGVVLIARDLAAHPDRVATLHAVQPQARLAGDAWLRAIPWAVGIAFAGAVVAATPARRRVARWALPAACAALAVALAFAWLPSVSRAVSTKALFESARGHEVAVLSVPARVTRLYADHGARVPRVEALVASLKAPARRFGVLPARSICEASQLARRTGTPLHVLDRSADFAVVSNEHRPGERRRGGLDDAIGDRAPAPRVPLSATFADGVELVGADLPARVGRGERFEVTLYFHVTRPPSKRWQVFAHFDRGSVRFQGDHWPVGDRCPSHRWNAGDYITDRFAVTAGDITYPPGRYELWVGFFVGSNGQWTNLELIAGDADPQHRVRVGAVEVR